MRIFVLFCRRFLCRLLFSGHCFNSWHFFIFFVQSHYARINQHCRHSSYQSRNQSIRKNRKHQQRNNQQQGIPHIFGQNVQYSFKHISLPFFALRTHIITYICKKSYKKTPPVNPATFFSREKTFFQFITVLHDHPNVLYVESVQTKNVGLHKYYL